MRLVAAVGFLTVILGGAAPAGAAASRLENGAVVVPAAFGDIAGDFILDASAPASQLHLTRAQADGLAGPDARADLTVAGERLRDITLQVVDLDARSRSFATVINGVIGADVLAHFVVEVRFSPCRLTLYSQPPTPWGGAVRLKVARAGGVPAVVATAFDGKLSREGLFAIDTASAPVRIAEASLSRSPPAGVDPDGRDVAPARLRALSLGGRLFENIPAGLIADAPAGLAGAIGDAVWSRFDMRLDLSRGWLELVPRP